MQHETQPINIYARLNSITNTQEYIHQTIIPSMMARRNRTQPMTQEQIVEKLFSTKESKPGEAIELINEGGQLNHHSASEIADIVYYTYQPNCPDLLKDISPLLKQYQITQQQAEMFCILKYSMRIDHGDKSIHKDIENLALQYYLQTAELTK